MTDLEEVPDQPQEPQPSTAQQPSHTCCFHLDSQRMLTSYPPQRHERCCFCGVTRRYTPPQPAPPNGHGPYHPHVYPYQGGVRWFRPYGTTTRRSCPCQPEHGGSGICGCILGGPVVTY